MRTSRCPRLLPVALLLSLLGASGPSRVAADEPPPDPVALWAGAWHLDTARWAADADEQPGRSRYEDMRGAVALAGVADSPFVGYGRPGVRWNQLLPGKRARWNEQARAFLAAERPYLEERLEIARDGSFRLVHVSRASEGGSPKFGLHGARLYIGQWRVIRGTLHLDVRQVVVPGHTLWNVEQRISAHMREGALHFEGGEGEIRQMPSVYRRVRP